MTREVNYEKLMKVRELDRGDKVKLTNGEVAEFVRLKKKNFVGIIDDKSYNIPVNMFVEFVEKGKTTTVDDIDLNPGDMFYIQANNGSALLFEFKRFKGNRIVGVNPINKAESTIDREMFVDKVS